MKHHQWLLVEECEVDMKNVLALLAVVLMAACMQDRQTDLEGLEAMRDVWRSTVDAKDAAAIAATYAEDGEILPSNGRSITGRTAIESYLADALASGIHIEATDTDVYAEGDVGYKVGTYIVTNGVGATVDKGKFVEIWRYANEQWLMQHDIMSSDLPLITQESTPSEQSEVTE